MLERLAGSPATHQLAQRSAFGFVNGAVKLEVKVHSSTTQHFGQQVFGLQAWAFYIMLGQIAGGGLNDFEDVHADRMEAASDGAW
jgi:hypothetical protein